MFVSFYPLAMAGNIIPAIATTNAVIAGLIVLEGLKILSGKWEEPKVILIYEEIELNYKFSNFNCSLKYLCFFSQGYILHSVIFLVFSLKY